MANRWYYLHLGQTHGPLTTEEIKHRELARLLVPDDLVWPEGTPQKQAVAAAAAIDFGAMLATASPAPDWLADVAKDEQSAASQARASKALLPDWLEDVGKELRAAGSTPTTPS